MASNNLSSIINLLRVKKDLKVAVVFGAGVSVSSGIPDFRSPGGMYATLKPELLTATDAHKKMMQEEPTAVVNISSYLEKINFLTWKCGARLFWELLKIAGKRQFRIILLRYAHCLPSPNRTHHYFIKVPLKRRP